MERYFKALNKIRELEERIGQMASREVALTARMEEIQSDGRDPELVKFLEEIASTKSKFAKRAREFL